jgi:hypothetical protein
MKRGSIYKAFVYVLCVSLFLLMGGFHQLVAEAKEPDVSIGSMVSRGEVKFEERGNVWRDVEPSYFPILKETKIRTDKGFALITLANKIQIEMDQNGVLSLSRDNRLSLTKGQIKFRIPSAAGLDIKVGTLSVAPSRARQAAKDMTSAPSQSGETIGSIFIHANGQVTVKSIKGDLTILNQDHLALAALSSKESVTFPSAHSDTLIVAQADESEMPQEGSTGWGTWTWVAIFGGAAVLGGIIAVAAGGGGGGGGGGGFICR